MTKIEYAWAIYAGGGLGCCICAWWMFLWAWRFIRYSAVATVMVIIFTPFAIDADTMTMAPAMFTMLFDGLAGGVEAIKPLIKLMVGIWLILIILIALYVVLTRHSARESESEEYYPVPEPQYARKKSHKKTKKQQGYSNIKSRGDLTHEEESARYELLSGEIPIRAIRD